MANLLFAAHPSTGHLNPMISIARKMRSEGHTVVFICSTPAKATKVIAENSFHLINIRPSLSIFGLLFLPLTSGYVETFLAAKLFFSGTFYYARAIGKALAKLQPDAVVYDFSFPGACLAAESQDIPFVNIYHAGLSFSGPGIPPFGSGLSIGKKWGRKGKVYRFMSDFLERSLQSTIARARDKLTLPPKEYKHTTFLSSPWLNLVLTTEASEAPRFPLPQPVFFIGPCFSGRQDDLMADFPFELLSSEKPIVYVSLGTVFNKKPKVFSKIISAFADGRFQLIVSAGGAFGRLRSQHLPPNILLFECVPQVKVLSKVDAVISHGGNNTVNETLAAGKPLLVIPVGGEQGDNASRVVYLGVGLRADIKKSTPGEIGEKINRLIEDKTFHQRAKEIADILSKTQGHITAARFIEHVAKSKQPILRPEGYPLTVTREMVTPWDFTGIKNEFG